MRLLASAHAERVRNAVDVVEPRGNECYLKNPFIVEADHAQTLVIFGSDARGVARDLHGVVEHHALFRRDGRFRIVLFERPD